jgi:predicted DNA-binding protein YlxM (UPF0122 family)
MIAKHNGIEAGAALYLDMYGGLLTEKQAEILDFYYNEDYSLSEIAEGLNISRQAAHDAVRSGTAALAEYEEKLRLVREYNDERVRKAEAREALYGISDIIGGMRAAVGVLPEMGTLADKLEAMARKISSATLDRDDEEYNG